MNFIEEGDRCGTAQAGRVGRRDNRVISANPTEQLIMLVMARAIGLLTTSPGSLTKAAIDAERAGDCDTVKTIATEAQRADASLHDVVFVHEIGIARCLASR
jgi:hypothetical protein